MANAYKCDRCGAFYEGSTSRRKWNIAKDNHPYGLLHLDICDDCYSEFVKFMNDGKKDDELDKQTND